MRAGQSTTEFIVIVVLLGFVLITSMTKYDSTEWWKILLDYFYEDSLMLPVEMIRYDDIPDPKGSGGDKGKTQYYLSATTNPALGGQVTGSGFYDKGTVPSNVLGQHPHSGYQFTKWEGPVSTPLTKDVTATAVYKKTGGGGGGHGGGHPYNPLATYRFFQSGGDIIIKAFMEYQITVKEKEKGKDGKEHTVEKKKKVTRLAARIYYNSQFEYKHTDTNPDGYSPAPPNPPKPNIKFEHTSGHSQVVEIQNTPTTYAELGVVHYDGNGNVTGIDFKSPYNKSGP